MNIFQFAVASVVDANTGSGLPHGIGSYNYQEAERRGRSIRAKTFIALLSAAGKALGTLVDAARESRRKQHGIRQLARLSDHNLEDIGLSRGDVVALQTGQVDLEQLQRRRRGRAAVAIERPRQPARDYRAPAGGNPINEAVFARAKCA